MSSWQLRLQFGGTGRMQSAESFCQYKPFTRKLPPLRSRWAARRHQSLDEVTSCSLPHEQTGNAQKASRRTILASELMLLASQALYSPPADALG